jgi:hypothetical protein
MQRKSDLYVITKVKELTEYIITVTEKSPKKFRFTLVARLQNYCLDVVENLYLANSLPFGEERLMHQQNAGRLLSMLGYFVMLASDCKCLLPSQAEYSSKLQAESLLFLEEMAGR